MTTFNSSFFKHVSPKFVSLVYIVLLSQIYSCKRNHHHDASLTSTHRHHAHEEGSSTKGHAMHHRFQDAKRWAQEFDDPKRDQWQKPDEVVALLELSEGMVVADIGAGTGYFIHPLAVAVGDQGQVLGLDIEENMVLHMNERIQKAELSNAEAKVIRADDPELSEASVDRILIVDTWHHISDRVEYSKKLAKALKPGGFVAVVDFTQESPVGPPKRHRLLAETIESELREAGLNTTILDESLPYQYVVRATKE